MYKKITHIQGDENYQYYFIRVNKENLLINSFCNNVSNSSRYNCIPKYLLILFQCSVSTKEKDKKTHYEKHMFCYSCTQDPSAFKYLIISLKLIIQSLTNF